MTVAAKVGTAQTSKKQSITKQGLVCLDQSFGEGKTVDFDSEL